MEYYSLLKMTKKTNYAYSDSGIWQTFSRNDCSELVTLRKNNWQYMMPQLSSENFNFGKLICHCESGNIPILKTLLNEISGDINECEFLILYHEMG